MKLKLSIFFLLFSFIMVAQHNFVLNGVCSKNANTKNIYLTYKVILFGAIYNDVNLDFDDLNTIIINDSKTNDGFYALENVTEKEKIHKKIDLSENLVDFIC